MINAFKLPIKNEELVKKKKKKKTVEMKSQGWT
jgi:hypothetical protein